MKKTLLLISILSLCLLNGCDDKNARDYANELVGVLKSYQTEVNKKIADEQKSYKDLAGTYAYAKQVDLLSNLRTERLRLADALADKLQQEDSKVTPSDIHKLVADYAQADFAATRQLFEQESDGQAEYLASLEALELQSKNLTALSKALQELGKPKSNIKQLKELGEAAKEFKKKFDELECGGIAEQIGCLKVRQKVIAESTSLSDEQKKDGLAKIKAEIDGLIELGTAQKCDVSKLNSTECPDKKGQ
ncbi:MAG: hypothetical protein JWM21_1886 [Acidobacteria bacterium]|nr:hypothetical protein [Acidobacteriota bacterium]